MAPARELWVGTRDLVFQDLKKAVTSIKNDSRVVIFKSLGKGFCAGADLKERSIMNDTEALTTLQKYRDLFNDIYEINCPTIARIHGFALGGGLELAMCCDFRVAIEQTVLGFPETSIGIIPGAGGTQRFSKLIGIGKAKEWIFTANRYTAKEAFEVKVLDLVFKEEQKMDNYIDSFSNEILKNSKTAIAASKRAIDYSLNNSIDKGLDFERKEYLKTLKSKLRKKTLNRYD